MIVLFTDFSLSDPYVAQVKSVLLQQTENVDIIDLLHNAPDFDITSSAFLLEAYTKNFPRNTLFFCVVDPGVGGIRKRCAIKIKNQWYVGPDNGLFDVLLARNPDAQYFQLTGESPSIYKTFDGRDFFAPIVAKLAMKQMPDMVPEPHLLKNRNDVAEDYPYIIYIDHYGNLISGYRYQSLGNNCRIDFNDTVLVPAETFSDIPAGEPFYYCNSNGLLEIAVNQGSAKELFKATIGDRIMISHSDT